MTPDVHELVNVAYKKLKQMVYFDKNLLSLRRRLADFESEQGFQERLDTIGNLVEKGSIVESPTFTRWLDDVGYSLIPKGNIKQEKATTQERGTFVTNVTSSKKYPVTQVNYIFDGPIELHLIAVLWLMTEGSQFDETLSRHCLGSRLHQFVGKTDDRSAYLFKKYHEQYAKWRDDGINKAHELLINEGQSVGILSLDVQEYYYRIQVDWAKLRTQIERPKLSNKLHEIFRKREVIGGRLFDCIQAICTSYKKAVKSSLDQTHPNLPDEATCLPIGLCSSPLIANWYLREFDAAILARLRPAYYARYVDDILLVVATEEAPTGDAIQTFMYETLVETGILKWDEAEERYELPSRPGLFLQRGKCNLQYFDAEHSVAGLHKFKKEIEDNASRFSLLPTESDDSPVEQVAYDLLYDGSVNKLRSVKAIAENRWELAQHLSRQTQLHLITDEPLDQSLRKELFRFFKGRSAIDYFEMWERVLEFLVIASGRALAQSFQNALKTEISKVVVPAGIQVATKLRKDLMHHLELSMELSLAVVESDNENTSATRTWRDSNLIRHNLVAIPLLNYTLFNGDFANPPQKGRFELDKDKIATTPRFVHFDECLLFVDSGFGKFPDIDSIKAANELYKKFHGILMEGVTSKLVNGKGGAK